MMRDFQYFTLAPLIDESSQQYKFEGGIEAVGNASSLPYVYLEYRFVYDSENEENGASDWQPYTVGDTITNQDIRWFGVQFRNNSGNFSNGSENYYNIKSTYDFDSGGRIMSLINYADEYATLPNYAFYRLFNGTQINNAHELILPDSVSENCYDSIFEMCIYLTTAPELPATTLANSCYKNMFIQCGPLTKAPALPATTLADNCYDSMFSGCYSLTEAPALPATTLDWYCYNNMFYGCTSLTTAPELPATTLADSCYSWMFSNCRSLTQAPELPATTLANSCYNNMFYGCTSLTTAPELPATDLAQSCYTSMFKGCTSLTEAPALPATTLNWYCYKNMFYGCTSLTTAPELPATDLIYSCYQAMFKDCTSLTTAPELPATNLANYCYDRMFSGCPKIDRIIWKSTTIPSSTYCSGWLTGTSASGTFEYTEPTLDVASISRDNSGVPAGWSISLLSQETKLLLKINNASVDNISLFGKKIASLSINGKKVKSSSAA